MELGKCVVIERRQILIAARRLHVTCRWIADPEQVVQDVPDIGLGPMPRLAQADEEKNDPWSVVRGNRGLVEYPKR